MNKKFYFLKYLAIAFGIFIFTLALHSLEHSLKGYRYHEITGNLGKIPLKNILFAIILTIVGYLTLSGYDFLATRYIKKPLSIGKNILVSFLSYSVGNNFGFGTLGTSAIRYRLYSAWGYSAIDIAKIIAFSGVTFWIGFFTLSSFTFFYSHLEILKEIHLPITDARPVAFVFILVVLGYLTFTLVFKKALRFRGYEFEAPKFRVAISQTLLATLDWFMAGTTLFVLLPANASISLPHFLAIFLFAQMAGIISHIPAGIGVLEAVIILYFSQTGISAPNILGSILIYRLIYYIFPLVISILTIATYEFILRKEKISRFSSFLAAKLSSIVPTFMAASTFLCGIILILSGTTPGLNLRLGVLLKFLPLPILEISHFMGSIVGVILLFIARGIGHRLKTSFYAATLLILSGALLSLLKGFDYEEALILFSILILLFSSKKEFYRKDNFLERPLSTKLVFLVLVILSSSLWLGFFIYRHVEYSNELWWNFTLSGHAPRFLRASVGITVATIILVIINLSRASKQYAAKVPGDVMEKIKAVVRKSPSTNANIALIGDKSFIFSKSYESFIMYGINGRSWVSMGDPVGNEAEFKDLIWRFREMADYYNGRPVFYEVSKDYLDIYVDLGLVFFKVGEEGKINLSELTLEGHKSKELRQFLSRGEREREILEVVNPPILDDLIRKLRGISDSWLIEKDIKEKGFSLGFFDEDYVKNCPCALIKKNGEIIAFANILSGNGSYELSVDLMRYDPKTAPYGVMDYLITSVIFWGKSMNYQWFNLGIAPLSGLEKRPLATQWHKLGNLLFRHGSYFYNFQSLRRYKEKFNPRWEPKYLACRGGFSAPIVLADIAALISRGLKGLVTK